MAGEYLYCIHCGGRNLSSTQVSTLSSVSGVWCIHHDELSNDTKLIEIREDAGLVITEKYQILQNLF